MENKKFVKGFKVKAVPLKYGTIFKCGVHIGDFCDENPMNERGWVNFDIKQGRSGNWYAELNTYKPNDNSDDEIPF
jgi:hypothetical protein